MRVRVCLRCMLAGRLGCADRPRAAPIRALMRTGLQGALVSSTADLEQQLRRSAVLQELHGACLSHAPPPAQQQWRSPSRQAGAAASHAAAAAAAAARRASSSGDAGSQLPHGLTAAMCEGLPRTESVLQLVEVRADCCCCCCCAVSTQNACCAVRSLAAMPRRSSSMQSSSA